MKAEMEGKIKYGVWGLICGAVIAMIIGFTWGGWTTASTTQQMIEKAALTNQAAICVAQFMKDPSKLKEFEGIDNYKRYEFIEKGGWDKMPGQEKASTGVSGACVTGIEALIKK
jgi:hypothetical protein